MDDALFLSVAVCLGILTVVHVICLFGLFHECLHNKFLCRLFFNFVGDKKKLFCILTLWAVFIDIAEGIFLVALSHRSDLDQNLLILFFTVIGEGTLFALRRATVCLWLLGNILIQFVFWVVVVLNFVEPSPVNLLLFGALGVNEVFIAFAVWYGIGPKWNPRSPQGTTGGSPRTGSGGSHASQSSVSQSDLPVDEYCYPVREFVSSIVSALFLSWLTSLYHPDSIARTKFMEAWLSIMGFAFASILFMLQQSPFTVVSVADAIFPLQLFCSTLAVISASGAVAYSLIFWRTLEDIDHPPDFDVFFSVVSAVSGLFWYVYFVFRYKEITTLPVQELNEPVPQGRTEDA